MIELFKKQGNEEFKQNDFEEPEVAQTGLVTRLEDSLRFEELVTY